jgi:hypothetical protein
MPEILNPDVICEDCECEWTTENEWVGDVFMCDSLQEYCLNCCACPEHAEGDYYEPKETEDN